MEKANRYRARDWGRRGTFGLAVFGQIKNDLWRIRPNKNNDQKTTIYNEAGRKLTGKDGSSTCPFGPVPSTASVGPNASTASTGSDPSITASWLSTALSCCWIWRALFLAFWNKKFQSLVCFRLLEQKRIVVSPNVLILCGVLAHSGAVAWGWFWTNSLTATRIASVIFFFCAGWAHKPMRSVN